MTIDKGNIINLIRDFRAAFNILLTSQMNTESGYQSLKTSSLNYILFRELQSVTNFFLMSLAVADLLVCMIVMPFGAIVFFISSLIRSFCKCASFFAGSWPLSQFWCIFYQTCDVLACSVSILHLMFISIGRYRGIRRPLQQRSESEHSTLFKVVLTWGLGMLLASPISVLALVNMEKVMPEAYL